MRPAVRLWVYAGTYYLLGIWIGYITGNKIRNRIETEAYERGRGDGITHARREYAGSAIEIPAHDFHKFVQQSRYPNACVRCGRLKTDIRHSWHGATNAPEATDTGLLP